LEIDLKNKVAIVTGAARGIGRAIALRLAKERANVVVADINTEGAVKVAEEIKTLGCQSLPIKVDVVNEDQVNQMVQATLSKFKRINLLVNNAGAVIVKPVIELTEKEWDAVIDVNLKGTFLCSKAIAKVMIKQKSGKIINISSTAGKSGNVFFVSYNAAKAGILGFTQGLAKELAPYKINVNAVCPGIVGTKMWDYVDEEIGKRTNVPRGRTLQRHVEEIPLGRIETPEDVAGVVAFLASTDADYMTGQAINVSGGRTMQ